VFVVYGFVISRKTGDGRKKKLEVVCGLWFVVCGLWFVVCGLWFVVKSNENSKWNA